MSSDAAISQSSEEKDRGLPLGWLQDAVEIPEGWETKWTSLGGSIRFYREVDRSEYAVKPPGWPGVFVTSGSDYWNIGGDSDHYLYDGWVELDGDADPTDTDAAEVVDHVEQAISAVESDLERLRLKAVTGDCVPRGVYESLVKRFGDSDRALEAMQNGESQALEATTGVGPVRREQLQRNARRYARTGSPEFEVGDLE